MRRTCVPLAPVDREEELTKTKRSINLIKYNVCWRTVPSFRCYVLWFCFRLLFSAFIYIFFRSYRMSARQPHSPGPPTAACCANIFQFLSQCVRLSSFSLFSFADDIYVFYSENICIYQKQTKFEECLGYRASIALCPVEKIEIRAYHIQVFPAKVATSAGWHRSRNSLLHVDAIEFFGYILDKSTCI